jgi:hypothetical protein
MKQEISKADAVLRFVCAVAMSLAAVLFALCLVALGAEYFHRDFTSHDLDHSFGLIIGSLVIGLLTYCSAYIAWRFWLGTLSANGKTMLPTWFLKTLGVSAIVGYAFAVFVLPYSLLLIPVMVLLWLKLIQDAKRRRDHDHAA